MRRKVQGTGTKGARVTEGVTSTPLAPTPQVEDGRAVKATGGACRGNTHALTTGARRSRTSRGGPSHRDRFDTQARRWTLETFRGRKYDVADPMRGILSDLESCIRGAKETLDRRGWHRADGEEKVAATSYHALTARKEALLRDLERRYCPVQAKAEEKQFVHICHFANGKVVGTSPSRDGKDQTTMIAEAERDLAIENLQGGGLPVDDSAIDCWWAGRLWSGEQQGMKIARFEDGHGDHVALMPATGTDATTEGLGPSEAIADPGAAEDEVCNRLQDSADAPVPAVRADPPRADRPQPAVPANVVPFVGTRKYRPFDEGGERR